jgi:glycosyltransferase involved in cell wall biosynthesis
VAGKRGIKVLFLFPYPHGTAASQRFRFEQYLDFLAAEGISYRLASFLDADTWKILYKPGHGRAKLAGILKGFGRRLQLLARVPAYDFVFIHREAAPLGPPVLEWIIAKVLRKRIIFDFDDAIWLANTSAHNRVAARLKWHHKTASLCRWAHRISAGNRYLAGYAGQFNDRVTVNPTTIDTEGLHNQLKHQATPEVVIGWTGTHSTIGYLTPLLPVLRELEKEYAFTFLVISDQAPDFALKSLRYLPWNKTTERADLLCMNIGIMPLTNDPWAQGKCGFKALQYMALGIPAVASPVGVNCDIIRDGVDGYLCSTDEAWKNALAQLLGDHALRTRLGRAARQRIEESYSVQANRLSFLRFFTA